MTLIFCGTPQFAVPTLAKLIAEGFSVQLVVTNPDEPSGRGYQKKASPVKQAAEAAGLPVFQPHKLKDPATRDFLAQFHPDVMVVVAYGHILPPWMLQLPRLGCLNVHASLLPKYRGAAPIQWAIIRGERITGITTMKIDAGLDTGDILLQREIEIHDDDTTETLSERLSAIGAELMAETLRGLAAGNCQPHPQDSQAASLAPILRKEDGRIDWSQTSQEIARRVRGLRPWPGAYTTFRGTQLTLWLSSPAAGLPRAGLPVGALLVAEGKLIAICGSRTLLELKELQLAGRKRVAVRDFLNGVRLKPDDILF